MSLRRFSSSSACFAAALLLTGAASAQTYPSKPVRIVVPSPPSGAVDVAACVVAGKLPEYWGKPVIIDNRAGASMTISAFEIWRC